MKGYGKYSWDGVNGPEVIIRIMNFGNFDEVKEILRTFGKEKLKELFLDNIHRFHGKERNFWKIVLEVSDIELERAIAKNLRESIEIRNFP
ncbi:hypothetical protein [Fervidobacterium thailandense]|uniref:Uncharacterized protein n=1 Tax=Fervidobacterium thailandense TaxID=1008305 RepID=A0A1E3G363_9BACT|nr:hypothetical protein [Fervidobacterium thailandense]ODN30118.1 hypothetical protein A4H02_07395 [Fervidobacterium thailandense]